MLPRFSIASRRRTMTPCLLMARAPAESVTLTIAGRSSGERPTARATAKEQRLDHRTVEKEIHRQHEEDDDDHHADQQVAELPEAAREVGLGRARAEPSGDRAERGAAPGLDDEDLRRAAAHRRAEKDGVGPRREGRVRRDDPGLLFDRERLARHARFADEEVLASMTRPSAGIRLPAESTRTSPGTTVLTGTVCSTPSRTTRQVSARRLFSSSTAAEARYSWKKPSSVLPSTIARMMPASTHCWSPSETAAAKMRMRTSGLSNCRRSRRSALRRDASSTLLGPTRRSFAAAASDERPPGPDPRRCA